VRQRTRDRPLWQRVLALAIAYVVTLSALSRAATSSAPRRMRSGLPAASSATRLWRRIKPQPPTKPTIAPTIAA
jgi:hypothetical protein